MSNVVGNDSQHHHRFQPNLRRKSQPHTHRCTCLNNVPTHETFTEDSTPNQHNHPMMESITPTFIEQKHESNNNVNKFMSNKNQSIGRPQDRSRISLNLTLKNVCSPLSRSQLIDCDDGSDVSTPSQCTKYNKELLNTKTAATMSNEIDETAGAHNDIGIESSNNTGFCVSIRSWLNTICQWRICSGAQNSIQISRSSGDIEQSHRDTAARNREASVGSVFGVGEMTTSSRILRAFSHVGEHL